MSYPDAPLDSVVQDDIDVTVLIGEREYHPVDIEVELTDGAEGNFAKGTVYHEGGVKPDIGDPLGDAGPEKVEIDVNNDLMEIRPGGGEISRIWTGYVSNASSVGENLFEFRSFNPGNEKIQNAAVNMDEPPLREHAMDLINGDGNIMQTVEAVEEHANYEPMKRASFIVDKIGELVTEDTDFGYEPNLAPGGVTVGTASNGETVKKGNDIKIDISTIKTFKLTGGEEGLLEHLATETNSIWDVRRDGSFYFGAPQPKAHKLRYIVDTSAGKASPYYLSVQVIGNGIVSQDGWDAKNITNATPESVGQRIVEDAQPIAIENAQEQLAQPIFVYRNLEINTRDEAENVLKGIVEEIRGQMGAGSIEVVGHPEVWPGHAVELPHAEKQPFDRERYLVKKVVHRINNTDGFLTTIEVGGMTKAAETVFNAELSTLEENNENVPSTESYLDGDPYDTARAEGQQNATSNSSDSGGDGGLPVNTPGDL